MSNFARVSVRTAKWTMSSIGVVGAAGVVAAATVPVPAPVVARTAPAPQMRVAPRPAPVVAVAPAVPVASSTLTRPPVFEHGAWLWDATAQGTAPIVVTVDLAAQTMSVWREGREIGVAVIAYGDAEKPTPLGRFAVTEKDADHVSNIFGSPMPHMLRLTNDGISIHATNVRREWATNGCVGVPAEFARLLFEQARLGTTVVITDGTPVKLGDRLPLA